MLDIVKQIFISIASTRIKQVHTIKLEDRLMSALAMFGLKSSSLLAFETQRLEKHIAHNLKKLYGIDKSSFRYTYEKDIG